MAYLTDSSIFISLERHGGDLTALHALGESELLALSCITATELLFGVQRASTPERRIRRETFVEAILTTFPLFPVDLLVARVHSKIWSHLAAIGQLIGDRDLLIAATALAHNYDILTENIKDFSRVPGLVAHRPLW